ncbi:MAG: rhomboid family intramembrane serine protease [Salaquimonas sp.]|nr:rhomboid family intramembrane serine protease [Salaquimonas sp.]
MTDGPSSGPIDDGDFDPEKAGLRPKPGRKETEPFFNLPGLVTGFAVFLVAVHLVRVFVLTGRQDAWTITAFAFNPIRYTRIGDYMAIPDAAIWSPITYSFLHGSWMHLFVNLLWLLAFATPVVRRLGTYKAVLIAILSSLAGAAAHFLAFTGQWVPMIGASAIVSGYMGAAVRFAFTGRVGPALNVEGPAQSLGESFSNPPFLAFLLVWLLVNFVAGVGAISLPGQHGAIAWQAHVGGFLAGLLSFSLLDRHR